MNVSKTESPAPVVSEKTLSCDPGMWIAENIIAGRGPQHPDAQLLALTYRDTVTALREKVARLEASQAMNDWTEGGPAVVALAFSEYEIVNLAAALEAIYTAKSGPLTVLNSGDWLGVLRHRCVMAASKYAQPSAAPNTQPEEYLRCAEASQAPHWQPIETAPKDGTRVLVTGHWFDDHRETRFFADAGYWRGGWRDYECDDEDYFPPTHWMPLPAPPTGGVK